MCVPGVGGIADVDEVQKQTGGNQAGAAVAWNGERAVIGSPGGTFIAAYRFEAGRLKRTSEFGTANDSSSSRFGESLALDGDTLVVGAPLDDHSNLTDAGSVFVFQRDQQTGQWVETQKLIAPSPENGDEFGSALAIDGDWILVGADRDNDNGMNNSGSIYFFIRQDGTWVFGQQRFASDQEAGALFGFSVALEGDWAVIGAPGMTKSDRGKAYFFRNNSGSWTEVQGFAGTVNDGWLGRSVAINGEWAFGGAPFADAGGFDEVGAVKVYRRLIDTWSVVDELGPLVQDEYENIGMTLALQGDRLLAGASNSIDKTGGWLGAVHEFALSSGVWNAVEVIVPLDRPLSFGDGFGRGLSIDGDEALIGATFDDEAGTNAGAAYFFDLTGQSGTRAILTDVAVHFGTELFGGLFTLKTSEDTRFRVRSRFGFTASEPNLAEIRIGATNYVENPTTLDILIEARINQSGGTMKVRLKNWNTNNFNQVHQYSIGSTETVEPVLNIPSANYIRAGDNRIDLSLRSSALATFSIQGFEAQHDFVNVLVHD